MPLLFPKLNNYLSERLTEFDLIPPERQAALKELGIYCRDKLSAGQSPKLIVICTHNSRRSLMGQLWLRATAHYYGLANIRPFSGGTEATAFNPRAVLAMREAGFRIAQKTKDKNPRYLVTMHPKDSGVMLFSKRYDEPPNPKTAFAPIMVCTEADKGCPLILGAEKRFALPYRDPKEFDNTPQEAAAYQERNRQIAREMFYALQFAVLT